MVVTDIEPDKWNPVLACQDSSIKVLDDNGQLLYKVTLEAPVVCLSLLKWKTSRNSPMICFGLKNGNIGALELKGDESIVLWEVDCAEEGKAPCAFVEVTTLKDELHLVVARDDGSIEIYWF